MPGKFEPKPINVIQFGQYKGQTFEAIHKADPNYLKWVLKTTDPADTKNGGKYAKQNQERIKYIQNLLGSDSEESNEVPEIQTKHIAPIENIQVKKDTFESIAKLLLKIDEKLDLLLERSNNKVDVPVQTESENDENYIS